MKCEEDSRRTNHISSSSNSSVSSKSKVMASHLLGSSSSSSSSCSSSSGRIVNYESSGNLGKKYPIKTLCFNKKLLSMPSKDEYSVLLCNGLGARKWVVSFELDAEGFKRAILKIYPLLSTVSGYTLWTINKDKEFEKLPPKVNTPKRISAYFGMHFSGCLIIMPSESIHLISSETLHPEILCNDRQPEISISEGINTCQITAPDANRNKKHYRQYCCLCGKTSKSMDETATGFYDIDTHTLTSDERSVPISSSLKSILNIDLNKINDFSNDNICKKCYRQLLDINYLQFQLKSKKEEMVSNFFHTMAKSIKLGYPPSSQRRSWTEFLSNEEFDPSTATSSSVNKSNASGELSNSDSKEESHKPSSRMEQDSPKEDDEHFNNNSSSLSPNSSPSPPSSGSGGGSSDSSASSSISATSSSSAHHHSWKKRYCEMTQVASFFTNVADQEGFAVKKKKKMMNESRRSGTGSDEDSGVNSSASNMVVDSVVKDD